jgi:hypothetical protein
MTLDLSREAAEILFGKQAHISYLKRSEVASRSGNGFALWDALMYCLYFQISPPEWLRNEYERIAHGLCTGKYKNFEEAFGVEMTRRDQLKRQEAYEMHKNSGAVLERLFAYRVQGGSMNSEEAFSSIAEELGISRNLVEKIKKKYGQFITDIPQRAPADHIRGYMQGEIEMPRSEGRPMFWEDEVDKQRTSK